MKTSNPYAGLRPFGEHEASCFCGRERDVDELLLRLRSHRFVAVLGPSGCGKTSLVQAGLIPSLKAGHLATSGAKWRTAVFRPGGHPLESLARALDAALGELPDRLNRLRASTHAVRRAREGRQPEENLLVVVDQFEEIFRADAREASQFIDLLLAAGQDVGHSYRVYVVLVLRSDRLGECVKFEGLPEALNLSQYLTPRMTGALLTQAIESPAAQCGAAVDPELVQRLTAEAADSADQLPLIQFVLHTLWDQRESGPAGKAVIPLAAYEKLGSAAEALNARADAVLGRLPEDRQRLARRMFRALALADVSHPAPLSRLAGLTRSAPEEVHAVAAHFLSAGLLSSPDPDAADPHVEWTHECVARQWKRLAAWLSEERRRPHKERTGQPAAATARRAPAAHRLRSRWPRQMRRVMLAAWAVFFVAVGVGSAWLTLKIWRTYIARETAREELAAAGSALGNGVRRFEAGRPEQAMGYFAHGLRSAPESLAAASWISALLMNRNWWLPGPPMAHRGPVNFAAFSPDGRRVVTASFDYTARVWDVESGEPVGAVLRHSGPVYWAAFSPDNSQVITASYDSTAVIWTVDSGIPTGRLRHRGPVFSAQFSPDGRRVVTASYDYTAQVWDADSSTPVGIPLRHEGRVSMAVFSPDGSRVATASHDETARVWDAQTGAPVAAPLQHRDRVNTVAFSPDGRRIVTAADDNTARVWDAATGEPVGAAMQHLAPVNSATFDARGLRVVTASGDTSARVWDAGTGAPAGLIMQHGDKVNCAAFSPDGRLVLTASYDAAARLWDPETGRQVAAPLQHKSRVNCAAFSGDGGRVVTATSDNTARVWTLERTRPGSAVLAHQGPVRSARFSPDGRRIITASWDHTARIWDGASGQASARLEHRGPVRAAAFSADGSRAVTASWDSTAALWDPSSGRQSAAFAHHDKTNSVALSSDGKRVVTASYDRTARLWDSATGQPVGLPLSHDGIVTLAAFSAGGRRVLTAASDHTARLWDAATGAPVGRPLRHGAVVYSAAFGPDGKRVVTASGDNTARVWDAETGEPLGPPLTHRAAVYAAAFSPDGRLVVTASWDHTARIWDAGTGAAFGPPLPHRGPVNSAAFSPDGRRVVTASQDGTARIWETASGARVDVPLEHRGPVNSAMFSPDGRRVVTASDDQTARVWTVLVACCDSRDEADRLATLAEAVSGYEVNRQGALTFAGYDNAMKRLRKTGWGARPVLSLDDLIRRYASSGI